MILVLNIKYMIKKSLSGGLYILTAIFVYKFLFNININLELIIILVSMFVLGFSFQEGH